MTILIEAKSNKHCREAGILLSMSENISSLLDDSESMHSTSALSFRLTRKLTAGEVEVFVKMGSVYRGGLLEVSDTTRLTIVQLLRLNLRPVNMLAKRFYHEPLRRLTEDGGVHYLSNGNSTAIMKLEKNSKGWQVTLCNSMDDTNSVIPFDSVLDIFQEYQYGFHLPLTKTEFYELRNEFSLISNERKSRPTIVNRMALLKVM